MTSNEILDTYRNFVHHRQETLIAKISDPFYVSPVLGTQKFTNIQRVFDRVSQYELEWVLYTGSQEPIEVLKRIFLFDQTKTEGFWDNYLDQEWDMYSRSFDINYYWGNQHQPKEEIVNFTSAYMVPGKKGEDKLQTVHHRCLEFIKCQDKLQLCIDMKDISLLFENLKSITGIGDFLASQVCFDFLWHRCTASWQPLYVLGCGAVRGANTLGLINTQKPAFHQSLGAINEAYNLIINDFSFITANGISVPLFPADIQNTFCEIGKFLRASGTKCKYKPCGLPIDYKVPGHWVQSDKDLVEIDKP
ncbi:nucleotide kinase domain-containing protein [Nostoc sp.]|uniref:nucleotide kinase domain-containing protein n=1 Tax=Nostoc sp. TaxID=1180 RepID=UPI002FF0B07D